MIVGIKWNKFCSIIKRKMILKEFIIKMKVNVDREEIYNKRR